MSLHVPAFLVATEAVCYRGSNGVQFALLNAFAAPCVWESLQNLQLFVNSNTRYGRLQVLDGGDVHKAETIPYA